MSEYTFIHIPRNGGTSIKRVINNLGITRTISHDRHVWSKSIFVPPVHTKQDISAGNVKENTRKIKTEVSVPYSPENIQRLVCHKTRCSDAEDKAVVVIRDPIDRVKSLYKFWRFGTEKKRRRRMKMGMKEEDIEEERLKKRGRNVEEFIEMFTSQEVSEENSNGGTFFLELILPQSYWVNVDLDKEEEKSKLVVIPYCKNVAEKINHNEFTDNTDIVSALYNKIKTSKFLKEKDHENFRKHHVEYTEMKLNESNRESALEKDDSQLFTDREKQYFINYYKSDYEMIEKLKI